MKILKIDLSNGKAFINNQLVAPVCKEDFLKLTGGLDAVQQPFANSDGLSYYQIYPVFFEKRKFELVIVFKNGSPYELCLNWDEGNATVKGWETSERELKADKKVLSQTVAEFLNQKPIKVTPFEDVFETTWGRFSVAINRHANFAKIDIFYVLPTTGDA